MATKFILLNQRSVALRAVQALGKRNDIQPCIAIARRGSRTCQNAGTIVDRARGTSLSGGSSLSGPAQKCCT